MPDYVSLFAWRRGVDGEGVDTAGQFIGQNTVDQAMAFHPGLTFEGLRHDIDPEMSLPALAMPGMTLVLVGFVLDLEALRRQGLGQFPFDNIGGSHVVP
jgi:hypothetical protein